MGDPVFPDLRDSSAPIPRSPSRGAGERFFSEDELETWVPFAALLELLPHELDQQLSRDESLTHFEYFVLSMLTNSPDRRLAMTPLAAMTNATLPRLSRVVTKLEERGFARRVSSETDARVTVVEITAQGRRKVLAATPGHVANVRRLILEALTEDQAVALRGITSAILARVDPEGRTAAARPRKV